MKKDIQISETCMKNLNKIIGIKMNETNDIILRDCIKNMGYSYIVEYLAEEYLKGVKK